jgi:hypothetical protein
VIVNRQHDGKGSRKSNETARQMIMFRKDELGQEKGKGEEKNSVRTSAILKNE